jgi:hypothetical protein
MKPVISRVQELRPSRFGYKDCPLRARARAAGFSVRLVPDGFLLGRLGKPRERFDTFEALMARLDEIERSQDHHIDDV